MIDRRLQVFYTVAKTGNITKAAGILNMTQPAVTSQIQKFEEYYNVQLLDRHYNGVSLTPIGESVFHHVKAIWNLHELLDQKLRSCNETSENPYLRIGVTAGGVDFLFRIVGKFCDFYRDVDVRVYVDRDENIAYKLEHRNIELALVEGKRIQENVRIEATWQDPIMVLMPAAHPLAASTKVFSDDLSHYPIICRDDGVGIYEQIFQRKPGGLDIYENYGSMDAVVDAVKLNIGLAVASKASLSRLSKTDGLALRDLDPPYRQDLFLISHAHHQCTEPASRMLGYINLWND